MPKAKYKPEDLEAALIAVRNGMSKLSAAKKYHVPRSTIQFRLSEKFSKIECGPPPILTKKEEGSLEEWMSDCSRKWFPRRKEDLQISVQKLLTENKRPNPFINNLPGFGWYKAFVKRHPKLETRTPERVTPASPFVSQNDLKAWFSSVEEILREKNALDILNDPRRIFNGDETNFPLCPKNSVVLAAKGTRNVYEDDKEKAKASITVLFTFSAAGGKVPPMVIFPCQRLPQVIVNSLPDAWGIGHSGNGWMKAELFYKYIANVFNTYIEQNNVPRPVILFVEGRENHISYQLSQLCSELQIILIALGPYSTPVSEPTDVAVFKPMKTGWKEEVMKWQRENPTSVVIKENIAPILNNIFEQTKPETLVSGFRECGLFPWNVSAIDFTECLVKPQPEQERGNMLIKLEQFECIVGSEMLKKFRNFERVVAKRRQNPEFFTLYNVWIEFGKTEPTSKTTPSNLTSDRDLRPLKKSKTSDQGTEAKVQPVTNSLPHARFAPTLDRTNTTPVEQAGVGTPTGQPTPPVESSEQSLPAGVLAWTDTPTRSGKKQSKRVPLVMTSKQWKTLFEEKREQNAVDEKCQAERKRKTETNKIDIDLKIKSKKIEVKNFPTHNNNHTKEKVNEKPIFNHTEDAPDQSEVSTLAHNVEGKKLLPQEPKDVCYACRLNFKENGDYRAIECGFCAEKYHLKCVPNDTKFGEKDLVFVCNTCWELHEISQFESQRCADISRELKVEEY